LPAFERNTSQEFTMKIPVLAITLLATTGLSARADTLLLDAISTAPPNTADGVSRPRSGSAMDSVAAQFGEPESKREAVGEPPITRWIYPGYTVYFEGDRVIEVVVHR